MLDRLRTPPARRLLLLAAGLVAAFAVVAAFVPRAPQDLRAVAPESDVAAVALVLAAWTVLTPMLFGGTMLAVASGLVLGPVLGAPVAIAGAVTGGALAFVIARRAGHGAVERLAGPRLARAQAAIERRGFVSVLCARLLPGVPATLLHYAAGLSRVRPGAFVGAIALGGAPRHVAYVALGGTAGDLLSPLGLVAVGAIALMSVVGAVLAWRGRPRARPPAPAPVTA